MTNDTTQSGPPTVYDVHARMLGDGRAQVDAGSETVTFDASWAAPPAGLPGPAELLPFSYEHAEVDVTACRQDTPPRFVRITYQLRLVTEEPERRIELLHTNLRRFGTVYNTLAAVCDVDGEILAVDPTEVDADMKVPR